MLGHLADARELDGDSELMRQTNLHAYVPMMRRTNGILSAATFDAFAMLLTNMDSDTLSIGINGRGGIQIESARDSSDSSSSGSPSSSSSSSSSRSWSWSRSWSRSPSPEPYTCCIMIPAGSTITLRFARMLSHTRSYTYEDDSGVRTSEDLASRYTASGSVSEMPWLTATRYCPPDGIALPTLPAELIAESVYGTYSTSRTTGGETHQATSTTSSLLGGSTVYGGSAGFSWDASQQMCLWMLVSPPIGPRDKLQEQYQYRWTGDAGNPDPHTMDVAGYGIVPVESETRRVVSVTGLTGRLEYRYSYLASGTYENDSPMLPGPPFRIAVSETLADQYDIEWRITPPTR